MAHKKTELDEVLPYLQGRLHDILSGCSGISEFGLLKALQQDSRLKSLFETRSGDSLALFRAHFLLFHVLYRLADELAATQQAILEISPLLIRYCAYQAGQQGLAQPDAVRDYYLDWRNYDGTGPNDVDELIASFWVGMHRLDNRDDALAVLDLADPVDDDMIRKAYQRLVMQHHPDRGGDEIKIQEINAAVRLLLK